MSGAIVWVSRPSPWGNPYPLGEVCTRCGQLHEKRGSTIPCFEAYLKERLAENPNFIEPLRGATLRCHGCRLDAETCHVRVYERVLAETERR